VDARLIAGAALAVALATGAAAADFDHSHGAWDALLGRHVRLADGGRASTVDYAGMARERGALTAYLDALAGVAQPDFDTWKREEQMAFLINAYNAFTVEKILTRYPDLRSIWDFGRFFGNPFKDEFFSLLGARRSLDALEHGMLRPQFRDPRIHYAANCASVGCPMLREEAYVGARLEAQLEEQARRFLSDRSRNRYDEASGRLQVSRIFDWYAEDFEPRARYFARFADLLADSPAARGRIAAGDAPLAFLDYDWALNDSRSSSPR
jgi:hypothetical protein